MGATVVGLDRFQRRLAMAPKVLGSGNKVGVEAIQGLLRTSLLAQGAIATGNLRLSNFGRGKWRGGIPLGLTTTLKGPGRYGGVGGVIKPNNDSIGEWYLLEFGSYGRPFIVGVRGGIGIGATRRGRVFATRTITNRLGETREGRSFRRPLIPIGGQVKTGPFQRGPVAPRLVWTRGIAPARKAAPEVWKRSQLVALKGWWGRG